MRVKAHLDPCFTLISGFLSVQILMFLKHRLGYSKESIQFVGICKTVLTQTILWYRIISLAPKFENRSFSAVSKCSFTFPSISGCSLFHVTQENAMLKSAVHTCVRARTRTHTQKQLLVNTGEL